MISIENKPIYLVLCLIGATSLIAAPSIGTPALASIHPFNLVRRSGHKKRILVSAITNALTQLFRRSKQESKVSGIMQ
jgi:hypothetical protein